MSTIPPSGIPLTKAEEDSLMQEREDGARAMSQRLREAAPPPDDAVDIMREPDCDCENGIHGMHEKNCPEAAAMDVPTALDLDAVKARFALTRDVGADHVLRPEEIRTLAESIADIPALLSELSRLRQEAEAMRPVVDAAERFVAYEEFPADITTDAETPLFDAVKVYRASRTPTRTPE